MEKELERHLELLKTILADVQYGNIVITVQDGKIVQIDKTEKYRIKS